MRSELFARADAARADSSSLRRETANLIACSAEDRELRGLLADGIRCSSEVDALIAGSIDEIDVDVAAALLTEARDLKAGIASVRDSLTRAPWVFR